MTNYQIAGLVVPCALRAANAAEGAPIGEETLIQLTGAISTAASVYGITSKREITKAAVKITPDFKQISKSFFLAAKETPVIAKATYSKDYEDIAGFVLQNQDLSARERLKLYGELNENKTAKAFKFLKKLCLAVILISILVCVGIYFLNPEVHDEVNSFFSKIKKHIEKKKKHVEKFIKFINLIAGHVIK